MRICSFMSLSTFIFLCFFFQSGCLQKQATIPLTSVSVENEDREQLKEINVGGKTWKIDPNLSYQATGVWKNPDPRPLTDDEKTRIRSLKKQLEMLKKQRERITKELTMLQRISKSGLKIRYNFGKPPFPTPGSPDFPTDNIIDLGEFQLQMESAAE